MAYNVPTKKFSLDKFYKSYTYIGTIKKGKYLGPTGSNALSSDKTLAMKKSLSEAVERKALMAGGVIDAEGYCPTYDLIQNKISSLSHEFTSYRITTPHIIDSTGTSAHINSQLALQKALEELLEKNSLFLFWYGREGWKLRLEDYEYHPLFNQIIKEGYDLLVFLNVSFPPLYTVIVVIYTGNLIISTGISASLDFNLALDAAIREAYLLKWEKHGLDLRIQTRSNRDDLEYLNHLMNFDYFDKEKKSTEYYISKKSYLEDLLECIPKWVSNLHTFVLKNTTFPNLTCIKVFSTDLYNHLPQKKYLDLNQTINKMTLNINEEQLIKICNCIIK